MKEKFDTLSTEQDSNIRNKQEQEKQKLISKYIEKHILKPFDDGEISEDVKKYIQRAEKMYTNLSPTEKASKLYEILVTRAGKQFENRKRSSRSNIEKQVGAEIEIDAKTTPTINYRYLSKLQALWNNEEVKNLFLEKYSQARVDTKTFKESLIGEEWQNINQQIEEVKKEHQKLSQDIFLKKIKDPEELRDAKEEATFLAQELIQLRQSREDIISLKDLPHIRENTDLAAMIQFEKMKIYRDQLKEGFVWLPSREEIHRDIIASLQNGRWPVLIGEGGTGKSEQADAAAKELTGFDTSKTDLACDKNTNIRDLIADKEVEDNKSYESYGPAMQAATGYESSLQEKPSYYSGRILRLEESGRLGTRAYSVIKKLRQLKQGQLLNGKKVLPGFASIWTTNPVGYRYPDRYEIDPAMRREISEIGVDYPEMSQENPELYEFMLTALMDEKYHNQVTQKELIPAYEEITIKNGKIFKNEKDEPISQVTAEQKIIENPTNKKHGTIYRLSYAIKSVQDSFVAGNKQNISDNILRYTIDDDENIKIVEEGGEALTLSSSTITLGEIASWMKGFQERKQKADADFQVETLTEWIQYKLNTYLKQVDEEDRAKIKAIFEHFHLFDKVPNIENQKPLTPLEIGYLSPRVPRPLILKKIKDENEDETGKPKKEKPDEIKRPKVEKLKVTEVMLENGEAVNIEDYSFEFEKNNEKIEVSKSTQFELDGKTYLFVGQVDQENSEYHKQLVVKVKGDEVCQIMEREGIERGENFYNIEIIKKIFEQEGKLENFYGAENLTEVWGYSEEQLEQWGIPNIEAPKWLLEKAIKMGATLSLKPSLTPNGKSLSILKQDELMAEEYKKAGGGILLYDKKTNWKMESNFYTIDNPNVTIENEEKNQAKIQKKTSQAILYWSLDFPPLGLGETGGKYMSSNKNYLEQTEIMIKFLEDLYKKENQNLPKIYQEAIKDFEKNKPKMEDVESNDENIWKPVAKKLVNLKITKLLRTTPSAILFDIISSRIKTKKDHPYLESNYVFTISRSSSGSLLDFGIADSDGVNSNVWKPRNSDVNLFSPFSLQL
ncbi:MAG TPA: hypothetical protein ENJ27_02120 [Candidatus Moranbacteria bacterium]|nr:hypothetical protein [Candidatus Moranbacteria bacterium]